MIYTLATQGVFWPTKKEVLSHFPEDQRERAGIVLDAYSDVQLIDRRYMEIRDKDGEYNRNTPCYGLFTAAELKEIHGVCRTGDDKEAAPKELLTED